MGILQLRLDQHIAVYDQKFHESLIQEQKILDSVYSSLKNQEFNLLERYQLDAKYLHLEVIERNYVEDSEKMFAVLTGLRNAGFLIEMDDFGTGESSLAIVARLPVDYLKLDRQFLVEDIHDKRHREVIRFILNMANALKVQVISEGIETKEQADLMYEMGCDYAQGFYYSRPRPYAELLDAE